MSAQDDGPREVGAAPRTASEDALYPRHLRSTGQHRKATQIYGLKRFGHPKLAVKNLESQRLRHGRRFRTSQSGLSLPQKRACRRSCSDTSLVAHSREVDVWVC